MGDFGDRRVGSGSPGLGGGGKGERAAVEDVFASLLGDQGVEVSRPLGLGDVDFLCRTRTGVGSEARCYLPLLAGPGPLRCLSLDPPMILGMWG